ncbi:ISAzo13-like element transposase-related protein [Desulfonema limicola]|uniref:ISAzo13-like element transposase-related protein n=1 Tax=Desulfonema limicola TaxID=45656 RepID=UPI003B834D7B
MILLILIVAEILNLLLRWTSKSTYKLAAELNRQGFKVSHSQVGKLLAKLDYSLQSNLKSLRINVKYTIISNTCHQYELYCFVNL